MSKLESQTPLLKLDSLGMFALIWAWAETIQPLNTHVAMTTLPGWLLPIATVLLVFFPSSTFFLLAFLILAISRTAISMPFVPNHILFMMLVNLNLLAALVQEFIRERSWQVDRKAVFDSFAKTGKWQLVLLYLFAAVAKLNTDYFNPEVSCAVALFDGVRHYIGFVPDGPVMDQIAIYSGIFFEFAIPVCLLVPATRVLGIMMALFFHLTIAVHPLWATSILTFTMAVFAMLILFVPREVIEDFIRHWQTVWNGFSGATREKMLNRNQASSYNVARIWIVVVYAVTLLSALAVVLVQHLDLPFDYVVTAHTVAVLPHFGSCMVFAGMSAAFLIVYGRRDKVRKEDERAARRPNACWLLVIVVFVNGLCPYVGLKTTTAFTMFSNLRTESSLGNHFFLNKVSLFGFQDNLVSVIESNDPLLRPYIESGDKLTRFELQRLCSRDYASPPNRTYSLDYDVHNHMFRKPEIPNEPVYVRYQIDGDEFFETRPDSSQDEGIFEPIPWYRSRLLAFRPVLDPGGPAPCDH